jgi:hypothetical protein
MDPLSLGALCGAIGGGASKFVEKAWESGERWIQSYFKDHKPNAQQKAMSNSFDFLTELASRIKHLEDEHSISKMKIAEAQDHPDFSVFLQKALITSAQTDSKEKHILLAMLVSERLIAEPESVFSLASKMACDAIAYLTSNQIKLLGLLVNLYLIRPQPLPPMGLPSEIYREWCDNFISPRLSPYKEFIIGKQDLKHLESLSCIKINYLMGRDINQIFSIYDFKFDFNSLKSKELKEKIQLLWNESGIQQVDLTTTGQIIGVLVSDMISKTKTTFDGWE